VIGRLRIVIEGAKARGDQGPNVLLTGPSGMGKTSLAGWMLTSWVIPSWQRQGRL